MSNKSTSFKGSAKAWLLAGALSIASPAVAWAENLADALVGAYEYSRLLENNRALLRAADEDVAITLSALRPVLNFIITTGRANAESRTNGVIVNDTNISSSTFTLQASWLLWDNNQTRFSKQAAEELVLATRAALISVEQTVLLRAVAAYVGVIQALEFVELSENNVEVLREELRAAQDRFEVGEVTRTDVSLAEAALAEARSGLSLSQGDLVNARQEYLLVVGRLPGELDPPPPLPPRPDSIDAAKAVALRNHPDIQEAQFNVEAAELNVRSAEAQLGPSIFLDADVGVTESRDNLLDRDESSIGVTYQQQIYSGGRIAATIRQAMAQRDASRANLLQVKDNISQEAASALVNFRVAEATLESTFERIEAADVAFQGVREEATLGARTTLDVLQAEQDLLDAEAARIAAQADLDFAAYEILAAQGQLTAANLGLGVTIYDPAAYYNQVKDAPAYTSQRGRQLDRVLKSLGKQ